MRNVKRIFLLLAIFSLGKASADEGMWLPSLLNQLNIEAMKEKGCKLSVDEIYNVSNSSLKDAIVALNHGSCTAELISSKGLLLTNHHCAFGDIQSHSSVEHNYLEDGFWAQGYKDELPNEGKSATFLIRVEDVTDRLFGELEEDLEDDERADRIDEIATKIEDEAKDSTHYEFKVKPMFESNRYFLFVYETFTDIRLVGAPPRSIGKFGGDTDNWMWPRHTGDFALYRIYCDKDGKPADYSEDNIPYTPKHYLPISLKGVENGDFAMVMGYPGSTTRYKTSMGIKYTMEGANSARINVRSKKLEIIKGYMSTSEKARIRYAAKYAGSSNYYKFSVGQNKGLKALKVIDRKEKVEDEFTDWLSGQKERTEKYGQALNLIKKAYNNTDLLNAYSYFSEAFMRGPEIFTFALRAKPLYNKLKEPDGNDTVNMADSMKKTVDSHFKDYDPSTDEKIVSALLQIYKDNVNVKYHPELFKDIDKKYRGSFDKYAADIFKKSVFTNKEKLNSFLNSPSLKKLEKDKAFQAALIVSKFSKQLRDSLENTYKMLSKGRRLFVAGLQEMNEGRVPYPDANSTMRITYGSVGGYKPRDAVFFSHYTTLKGYIEKEIPEDIEFHVPQKMKELYYKNDFGDYADKDGSLHTCFITDNDITGGNSGSPVINGNGELVGIAFDGNWEAMSGDIAFEPELQKCINVDIRFVLWAIDKFAGAGHLVDEMTIVK